MFILLTEATAAWDASAGTAAAILMIVLGVILVAVVDWIRKGEKE